MKYAHHKYTWSKPFGYVHHNWQFVGRWGGMHFHVSIFNGQPSAGLEIHYAQPPASMQDQAPSQMECQVLKGKCWHDGTSVYASDHLWPIIEPMLRSGDHETIFRVLEGEADTRFAEFEREPSHAV